MMLQIHLNKISSKKYCFSDINVYNCSSQLVSYGASGQEKSEGYD